MRITSSATALPRHYYPQNVLLEAFRKYWGPKIERFDVLERCSGGSGALQRAPCAGRVRLVRGTIGVDQGDHLRPALQASCHRDDVVIGDGTDLAEGLGDDQIHVEVGQRILVEGVEVLALAGQASDSGGRFPGALRNMGSAPRPPGNRRAFFSARASSYS